MILSSDISRPLTAWYLVPALSALLAYAWAAARGEGRGVQRALPLAWGAHGLALLADLFGGPASEGLRFGFAPALSATVWTILLVHAVESRFVPVPAVRRLLAGLAGLTVLLALVFPGEGARHAGSPWAPLHWLLGLASYGLFGAAVLHGAWLDRAERGLRGKRPGLPGSGGPLPLLALERLTFRFVEAGFVVLSIAIVLGWWFTPVWRWDHKTVFSALGWLVFAGLLAGRSSFGWRGRLATRWLYAGSVLLLLAYVGSRFVFEVLLHRPAALGGAA